MAQVNYDTTTHTFTGSGTYDQAVNETENLTVTPDSGATITFSNNFATTGDVEQTTGTVVFGVAGAGTVNSIDGNLNVFGANSTMNLYGNMTVGVLNVAKNGKNASVNIYEGSELTVTKVSVNNINNTNTQGAINQYGGTVTCNTVETTGNFGLFKIGHWNSGSSCIGEYNLIGGTLSVLNSWTYLGWDGHGRMNISGGEATLMGISLSNNSTAKGYLTLTGGTLNLASSGVVYCDGRRIYQSSAKNGGTPDIKLGQGTVNATESHTWASNIPITLNGRAASSTADVAGGVTTFNADTGKTITLAGAISGVGALTKTGAGTLTLSGANTFSGNVTISGGKLNASSEASLGSNSTGRTVTVGNGAELVFTVNNVITNAHNDQNVSYVLDGGRISNSGSVYNYLQNLTVKNGATIYAANGLSDWKAFKLHNVNVVRKSDDSAGAAVVFSASSNANATFSFGAKSSTIQDGTSSSTINVAEITSANASVNDNVSDLVISAVIADPLYATGSPSKATKIVKTGAGTLELSGANTFTGPLVVEEGTLKVSKSTSLGANSAGKTITVGSGGEIVLAVSNVFSDAHNDQNVSYVLDGGRISNSGAVYNYLQNLTLKDGASVYASDGHTPWNAYKFFNVSVERNSDGTAGAPVVFSADMNKEHATFAFGAKSSEAGTKTAVIYVEDITSSNPAVVDNVSDLVISGIIANTLINGDGTTAAAPIEKTGAGTLEFTAANTYTGSTTISGGTLKLSGAAVESIAGKFTVNDNGTLELNVDEDTTLSISEQNAIFSTGKVIKTGDGELKIDAPDPGSIDAQSFVISSGRVDIKTYFDGQLEVKSGATFSPGNSVGPLTINSQDIVVIGESTYGDGFILTEEGSELLMEIKGSTADDNDVLIVQNGNILLGNGIIELAMTDDCTLGLGESFTAVLSAENSNGLDVLGHIQTSDFTDLKYVLLDSGTYSGLYAITGRRLNANEIPEPSTWALLVLGAAGLLYVRKRKN